MKIKIINVLILLATLVGTLICLSCMPDTVPVHFDVHGLADRWGSKYEMLIMPGCMAAMIAFWFGIDASYCKKIHTSSDEKAIAEAKTNVKVLNITFTIISIMFLCLNFATIYMSYSQLESSPEAKVDVMKIVTVVIGLSFILLGNIMPKTRNNPTVGFRLPWTRFNDATWQKCNRIAGIVMVISGVLSVIAGLAFKGMLSIIVMLLVTILSSIIITVYAYGVYKEENKNEK